MNDTVTHTAPCEVRRFLSLSTCHLSRPDEPTDGGVHAIPFPEGWWVWVPDDPAESADMEPDPVPPAILAAQKLARRLGCDWIQYDADGPTNDNLPRWEW